MKKIIYILFSLINIQLNSQNGSTPISIQAGLKYEPDMGYLFPDRSEEELKSTIPKFKSKTVKFYDSVNEKFDSFQIQPPEVFGKIRSFGGGVNFYLNNFKEYQNSKFRRFQIKSPNSASIWIVLKKTFLKDDERIFVYTPDYKQVLGPFTKYHFNEKGNLLINGIKGDECIIEYNSPQNIESVDTINISYIVHAFNSPITNNKLKGGILTPRGGNCFEDVNCSQFDQSCNQIRSTVMIVKGQKGNFVTLCSGALLNNPDNDYEHLILSAQHCFDDFEPTTLDVDIVIGIPILSWFFDWAVYHVHIEIPLPWDENRDLEFSKEDIGIVYNFQHPKCNNIDGVLDEEWDLMRMNTFGANNVWLSGYYSPPFNLSNDIALIQMYRKPEFQWNVYYSSWDAGFWNINSLNVDAIHHPHGWEKKFSKGALLNPITLLPVWSVAWLSSVVEPGSSGSPLFNDRKEVIGPLSGGLPDCQGGGIIPTSFYGNLRMWQDFKSLMGSTSCHGSDPLRACISNINLNDDFYAPKQWRDAKPSIKIQANNTINISTDMKVHFQENAEYEIQAGDDINIMAYNNVFETGTSFEEYNPMNGQFEMVNKNTELEFYTAPCIYTP